MPATDKYKFGGTNSLSATDEHEFVAANSFTATNKHKFGAQEDIIHEFYEVKLGKQGFALRHKYEFGGTNSFPALDKCEFGGTNSFTALNKHEFGATNSFPAFDKYKFVATNSFTALKDCKFGAQNSFTAASTGSVAICEFYEVKLVSSPKGLRLEPVEITHTATTTAHAAEQYIKGGIL